MITPLRATAMLLGFAVVAPALAVEPPLYLHREFLLSPQPPVAATPRDDAEVALVRRHSTRIATFLSAPAGAAVRVGDAVTSLFLVTRRVAMEDCADVTVEFFRLDVADRRTAVASNTVRTSILRRRRSEQPVVVAMTLDGLLAAAGERIGLDVLVTNECDSARSVTLLYDSVDEPSAVVFTDDPFPPTTTTTLVGPGPDGTTTTTTTVGPGATTTTLAGPEVPASCLAEPLVGFALLQCRLDTIAAILRAQPVDALGGFQMRRRLLVRLDRARALVAAAAPAAPRPVLMTRALRSVRRFSRLLHRGARMGHVQGPLVGEIDALAAPAMSQMHALRRGR